MAIKFYCGDNFLSSSDEAILKKWISVVVESYGKRVGVISYRFCDDKQMLEYNVDFLNHDTYTDIITFDYVKGDVVSGDILISEERVGENASKYDEQFADELHRVIIHGVLHLLGLKDKSSEDSEKMRSAENNALMMLKKMSA